jgi:hypothetical protein
LAAHRPFGEPRELGGDGRIDVPRRAERRDRHVHSCGRLTPAEDDPEDDRSRGEPARGEQRRAHPVLDRACVPPRAAEGGGVGPPVVHVERQRPAQGPPLKPRHSRPGGDIVGQEPAPAPAAQRFIQHHADRVHVGLGPDVPPVALLRRHVRRRPGHDVGPLARDGLRAARRGDAEIHEDRSTVDDEDVLRLDVAMHHAAAVKRLERVQQVPAEGEHLLAGQPLALHVLSEGLSVAQVLHGVVRESPRRSGTEHPHDVGMPEIGQDAGFGEEAVDGLGRGKLRPDDLDGHEPVESRLARHEHRAHAAARDLA